MIKNCLILICTVTTAHANGYLYAPSEAHPFGKYNPLAPAPLKDFEPLIGVSKCLSTTRIDKDNWTPEIEMYWTFKYIMNGMGVLDSTLKSDGKHGGSLRQYDIENKQWNVHYYTNQAMPKELPSWQGGKQQNDLVFWRENKAPNGMDGFYRLTFYEITTAGFEWVGEWVDTNLTVNYPTWKISCTKQQ